MYRSHSGRLTRGRVLNEPAGQKARRAGGGRAPDPTALSGDLFAGRAAHQDSCVLFTARDWLCSVTDVEPASLRAGLPSRTTQGTDRPLLAKDRAIAVEAFEVAATVGPAGAGAVGTRSVATCVFPLAGHVTGPGITRKIALRSSGASAIPIGTCTSTLGSTLAVHMAGRRLAFEVAVAALAAVAFPIATRRYALRVVARALDGAGRRLAFEVAAGSRLAHARTAGAVPLCGTTTRAQQQHDAQPQQRSGHRVGERRGVAESGVQRGHGLTEPSGEPGIFR